MDKPAFYDAVEPIVLYDPLADFLGAYPRGRVRITYTDCVTLAGHSCPTVAGAYLMAREGLGVLYPDILPRRSEILVEFSGEESAGVVGVIGHVIGYIAGASGAGGFKGIGGKFARNDRLRYGVDFDGDVRLTRMDTNTTVTLRYDPSVVPGDARMKPLMQKVLQDQADAKEVAAFQSLWQGRTEAILTARNTTPFLTLTQG